VGVTRISTLQIESLRKEMAQLNETLAKDKVRLRHSEAHITQVRLDFESSSMTRSNQLI